MLHATFPLLSDLLEFRWWSKESYAGTVGLIEIGEVTIDKPKRHGTMEKENSPTRKHQRKFRWAWWAKIAKGGKWWEAGKKSWPYKMHSCMKLLSAHDEKKA